MVTADQIKSLGERLERLASYLNLEQKRIHIINEEEKTTAGQILRFGRRSKPMAVTTPAATS